MCVCVCACVPPGRVVQADVDEDGAGTRRCRVTTNSNLSAAILVTNLYVERKKKSSRNNKAGTRRRSRSRRIGGRNDSNSVTAHKYVGKEQYRERERESLTIERGGKS